MSETFLGGARLPRVSKEFIEQLDAAYPHPKIIPGMDRDTVLWDAACRSVVEWIKFHATADAPSDPIKAQRAVVRLGS